MKTAIKSGTPSARCPHKYRLVLFIVNRIHMLDKLEDFCGITPFIIIPGKQFYKFIIDHHACRCIKVACMIRTDEICGNHLILGVGKNTLHSSFCSFLYCCADGGIIGCSAKTNGHIHQGNIGSNLEYRFMQDLMAGNLQRRLFTLKIDQYNCRNLKSETSPFPFWYGQYCGCLSPTI